MGAALPLVDHHEASELRALARRAKNGRVASRMVAIADALDDMTRVKALSRERRENGPRQVDEEMAAGPDQRKVDHPLFRADPSSADGHHVSPRQK